jgi:hypothetical protein
MLLGTVLALAVVWPARGESVPFPASVQTDGAEVRCKPGTEPAVYVTHKLPRGAALAVVERLPNGWLKIDPPKGSYSWVNTRALRPADGVQGVWVVTAGDAPVPVYVGSPFKPGKPDVTSTSLARGAQVIAVGQPRPSEDGDGSWLPILPPPGEYRFIREADVSATGSGPTTATTVAHPGSAAPPPATGGQLPPVASPADTLRPQPSQDVHVPGPAPSVDPLLQQAEQLERSGDKAGAARLYDQLGNKYFASNHDAAVQYYNRAAWLRSTTPAAPSAATQADALFLQARQYEQAGNRAEASKIYIRLGDMYRDSDYTLAMQYYNRASWLRQGSSTSRSSPVPAAGSAPPPAATPSPSAAPARAVSAQMLGPGLLLRSASPIDGRPTYVLQTPQAQVIAYLTPQAGVDLEGYVGKNVEAIGQVVPRSDVRDPYMSVAKVRLLTAQ